MKVIKLKRMSQSYIKSLFSVVVINKRDIYFYKNGKQHSDHSAAVIIFDLYKNLYNLYKNLYKDVKHKYWYKNGLYHREDGPAIISNGKAWFYEGKRYGFDSAFTKETWIEKVKEIKFGIFK